MVVEDMVMVMDTIALEAMVSSPGLFFKDFDVVEH